MFVTITDARLMQTKNAVECPVLIDLEFKVRDKSYSMEIRLQ